MEYDHKRRMDVMMDGKVYMDFYMASNGSCSLSLGVFCKNHLSEVGRTQNPGNHGTPNAHDRWFIIFLSCVRIRMNGN
jgi:hypothetical protein